MCLKGVLKEIPIRELEVFLYGVYILDVKKVLLVVGLIKIRTFTGTGPTGVWGSVHSCHSREGLTPESHLCCSDLYESEVEEKDGGFGSLGVLRETGG